MCTLTLMEIQFFKFCGIQSWTAYQKHFTESYDLQFVEELMTNYKYTSQCLDIMVSQQFELSLHSKNVLDFKNLGATLLFYLV